MSPRLSTMVAAVVALIALAFVGAEAQQPPHALSQLQSEAARRVVEGEDVASTLDTAGQDRSLAADVRAIFLAPATRKILIDDLGAELARLFAEKMSLEEMNAVSAYTLSPLGRSAMQKVNTDNESKLTAEEIAAYQKFAAQPVAKSGLQNFESAKAEFKKLGPSILPQLVEKLKQAAAKK